MVRGGAPHQPWLESSARDADGLPKGAGRRQIHWKHLSSSIVFGSDVTHATTVSPTQQLRRQRRSPSPTARRILKDGFPFEHELERPSSALHSGKKHVPSGCNVHTSSLGTSSLAPPEWVDRFTKRRVPMQPDALDDQFQPREDPPSVHHSAKRTFGGLHIPPVEVTGRVLDTSQAAPHEVQRTPRGLRCNKPADEIPLGSFVGSIVPKMDRGRKCHYDVPQTLSFKY
jgi:hypothetical protein